VIAEVFPHRE
jgi:DNA-binding NarL/FixJ family response regulator